MDAHPSYIAIGDDGAPEMPAPDTAAQRAAQSFPCVSIITPCYNEHKTIGLLLEGVYRQSYPRAAMEVVIADGGSTDATLEVIREFQSSHPDLMIRVVSNPQRITPAALNRAIAAARGEILIRLDAHSIPAHDYVARCVAALEQGLGDNVGGVWEIRPGANGWIARAIAVAAATPSPSAMRSTGVHLHLHAPWTLFHLARFGVHCLIVLDFSMNNCRSIRIMNSMPGSDSTAVSSGSIRRSALCTLRARHCALWRGSIGGTASGKRACSRSIRRRCAGARLFPRSL